MSEVTDFFTIKTPSEPLPVMKSFNYLSNNTAMPVLGVTSWMCDENVPKKIEGAIQNGFRQIEVSNIYKNEKQIGVGIGEAIRKRLVKRTDLFVVLKIWLEDDGLKDIRKAVINSIDALKLKNVDMVLAHIPATFNKVSQYQIAKIWVQMDKIYQSGLTKSVGVVNWTEDQIEHAMRLKLTPVHLSQKELGLCSTDAVPWTMFSKHRIIFSQYATLGSPGDLNYTIARERETDWILNHDDRADEAIQGVAKAMELTAEKTMLYFAVHRGFMATTNRQAQLFEPKFPIELHFTGTALFWLQRSGALQHLYVKNPSSELVEDLSDELFD